MAWTRGPPTVRLVRPRLEPPARAMPSLGDDRRGVVGVPREGDGLQDAVVGAVAVGVQQLEVRLVVEVDHVEAAGVAGDVGAPVLGIDAHMGRAARYADAPHQRRVLTVGDVEDQQAGGAVGDQRVVPLLLGLELAVVVEVEPVFLEHLQAGDVGVGGAVHLGAGVADERDLGDVVEIVVQQRQAPAPHQADDGQRVEVVGIVERAEVEQGRAQLELVLAAEHQVGVLEAAVDPPHVALDGDLRSRVVLLVEGAHVHHLDADAGGGHVGEGRHVAQQPHVVAGADGERELVVAAVVLDVDPLPAAEVEVEQADRVLRGAVLAADGDRHLAVVPGRIGDLDVEAGGRGVADLPFVLLIVRQHGQPPRRAGGELGAGAAQLVGDDRAPLEGGVAHVDVVGVGGHRGGIERQRIEDLELAEAVDAAARDQHPPVGIDRHRAHRIVEGERELDVPGDEVLQMGGIAGVEDHQAVRVAGHEQPAPQPDHVVDVVQVVGVELAAAGDLEFDLQGLVPLVAGVVGELRRQPQGVGLPRPPAGLGMDDHRLLAAQGVEPGLELVAARILHLDAREVLGDRLVERDLERRVRGDLGADRQHVAVLRLQREREGEAAVGAARGGPVDVVVQADQLDVRFLGGRAGLRGDRHRALGRRGGARRDLHLETGGELLLVARGSD